METVGERIRKLRGYLGLTQEEFASRIGSARNTIAGYEIGKRTPSNQVIVLICSMFNVNPSWLKLGSGEMLLSRDIELDAIVSKYNLTHNEEALIKGYLSLSQDDRNVIIKLIEKVSAEFDSNVENMEDDLHADLQREIDSQKKAEEKFTGSASTSA